MSEHVRNIYFMHVLVNYIIFSFHAELRDQQYALHF